MANISKMALEQAYKALEEKNLRLEAELAAKSTGRQRNAPKQPKTLEYGIKKLQNADYVGATLTRHTTAQILDYKSKLEYIALYDTYIKVSGRVLINGKEETFPALVPVLIAPDATTLVVYGTEDKLEPVDNVWDTVRVVSMRQSSVERYYIHNGKVLIKSTSSDDASEPKSPPAETPTE